MLVASADTRTCSNCGTGPSGGRGVRLRTAPAPAPASCSTCAGGRLTSLSAARSAACEQGTCSLVADAAHEYRNDGRRPVRFTMTVLEPMARSAAVSAPVDAALSGTWIDTAVRTAHPEYVAVLIAAVGLRPGPTTENSDALLRHAETQAGARLAGREPHDLPEVLAWRLAYRGFGVKPREARSSVEALLRRVNADTEIDPAHRRLQRRVGDTRDPIGGEDLSGYVGRRAWSSPPATRRSTRSPVVSRLSTPRASGRSSGATTPA